MTMIMITAVVPEEKTNGRAGTARQTGGGEPPAEPPAPLCRSSGARGRAGGQRGCGAGHRHPLLLLQKTALSASTRQLSGGDTASGGAGTIAGASVCSQSSQYRITFRSFALWFSGSLLLLHITSPRGLLPQAPLFSQRGAQPLLFSMCPSGCRLLVPFGSFELPPGPRV